MDTVLTKKAKFSLERFTIPLVLVLSLCLTMSSISENHLGVLIIPTIWIVIGFVLIRIFSYKRDRGQSKLIFLLFFTLYYIYMYVTNSIYVADPYKDFFYHLDSLEFYITIDSILRQSDSFSMYDRVLFYGRNWPGFATISWLTGLFSSVLGETNNIVVQKTQNVFVCSMTITFLYNMVRLYFPKEKASRMTIYFGLLSHVLVFSGAYSRDAHILLLYTIAFFIFLKPWRFKNIFWLVLIGIVTAQFRLQHGMFFIIIIVGYLYLWAHGFKNKALSYFLAFICLSGTAVFVTFNMESYDTETVGKIESYQRYHAKQFQESSGFTSVVSRLPPYLLPIGNAFIAQTYPYPPHRVVYVSVIGEYQYLLFPLGMSQVFWIGVWCVLIYGLMNSRIRDSIPFNLKLTLILGLLLILATASGSYEFRRMLGAYPVLYLASAFVYFKVPDRRRRILVNRILVFQIAAFCFYIAVKGF